MSNNDKRFCVVCGASHDAKELSSRGKCRKCSKKLIQSANQQIVEKRGPVYDNYQARMTAGIDRRKKGD